MPKMPVIYFTKEIVDAAEKEGWDDKDLLVRALWHQGFKIEASDSETFDRVLDFADCVELEDCLEIGYGYKPAPDFKKRRKAA